MRLQLGVYRFFEDPPFEFFWLDARWIVSVHEVSCDCCRCVVWHSRWQLYWEVASATDVEKLIHKLRRAGFELDRNSIASQVCDFLEVAKRAERISRVNTSGR